MDAQPQGGHAPRANEEHIEPEILPVASPPGSRARQQGRDRETQLVARTLRCRGATSSSSQKAEAISTDKRDRKSLQWFNSTTRLLVHIKDSHISTSWLELTWAQAKLGHQLFLIKGKEDPHIASSILTWLWELGHSKVVIQSDGEPASEVVMRMVQSKGAMVANPTM